MLPQLRHVLAALALLIIGNVSAAGEAARQETLKDSGLSGEKLVERHCIRCHSKPRPAELSKEFWPMALYNMASYVGMKGDEFPELTVETDSKDLELPYPKQDLYAVFHRVTNKDGKTYNPYIYYDFSLPQPVMTKAEWLRIKDYFVANARPNEELKIRRSKAPLLKGFKPVIPKLDLEPNGWVLATAVDSKRRRLFAGRAGSAGEDGQPDPGSAQELLAFDLNTGKRLASTPLQSLPIDLEVTPTGARLSTHGLFYLTRKERGISQLIDWDLSGKEPRVRMLGNGLERLTQHHTLDMNGDKRPDFVLSAYGDGIFTLPGGLVAVYWQTDKYQQWWQTAKAEIPRAGVVKEAFRETVLNRTAGIISSTIADFNGDGRPDIAAMLAQGKQQIIMYFNNGNETFTEQVVTEHGPAAGGNTLKAADFNGDGRPDIFAMYGDGPNGRDGQITVFKPDHGIRVFENQGGSKFVEKLHYRMQGAVRGVAQDFDKDGDTDIAVIALYPDWSLEEPETFVYLENQGNWQFKAASLSSDAYGVWSSIEVADVDANGKPDIVLGLANGIFAPSGWAEREHVAGGRGKVPTIMFLMNENR